MKETEKKILAGFLLFPDLIDESIPEMWRDPWCLAAWGLMLASYKATGDITLTRMHEDLDAFNLYSGDSVPRVRLSELAGLDLEMPGNRWDCFDMMSEYAQKVLN